MVKIRALLMPLYSRKNLVINTNGPDPLKLLQPVSNGQVLIFDAALGSFVPEPIDNVSVVATDISERDALASSLGEGATVFVKDTGQGESAFYLWDGSQFVLISTFDSAQTDAQTLSVDLTHSSPSQTVLGRVSPTSKVVNVYVVVTQEFNGTSPTLSIGDDTNGVDIHMAASLNDLTVADTYISGSSFVYTGSLEIEIKAYLNAGGSTQGQAQVLVTYV